MLLAISCCRLLPSREKDLILQGRQCMYMKSQLTLSAVILQNATSLTPLPRDCH